MVRLVFIAVFLVGLGSSIPTGAAAFSASSETFLTVYPNPFKSSFTLNFRLPLHTAEIIITDILGKPILNKHITNMATVFLDLEKYKLENGVYIVNVKSINFSLSKRVVKS